MHQEQHIGKWEKRMQHAFHRYVEIKTYKTSLCVQVMCPIDQL